MYFQVFHIYDDFTRNVEPVDDPLAPHGRQWLEIGNVAVELCVGTRHLASTSLNWGRIPEYHTVFANRKALDYFRLLFPMQHMNVILANTNIAMRGDLLRRGGDLELHSMLTYLGIQLAKAVDPSPGGNHVYWATSTGTGSTMNAKCFNERFGVSRGRYETITKHLHLNTHATPEILQVRYEVFIHC